MKTINGQFNYANVMIDEIEDSTRDQIQGFLDNPSFAKSYIAIMPDCHAGAGSCIGFTMQMNHRVIPNVIGVDVGCVDKDTEFLSSVGWKKISEYNGELVAQYDKETDKVSFIKPDRYVVLPCDRFYRFAGKNGLDMHLSEEHKMLVWKGYRGTGYSFVDISAREFVQHHNSLKKGIQGGVKTVFGVESKSIEMSDDDIRVIVMISADGRLRRSISTKPYVELRFKKIRKVQRAKNLLSVAGIPYKEHLHDGITTLSFSGKEFYTKDLSIFWASSQDQLKIVAEESQYWDGGKTYWGQPTYSTTVKSNADLIQFAYAVSGVRMGISVIEPKKDNWNINYNCYGTKNEIVGFPPAKIEMVESVDGKKYCFTVRTGYFVARRNNNIFITGNCGMLSCKFNLNNVDLVKLDQSIKRSIPVGFWSRKTVHPTAVDNFHCDEICGINMQKAMLGIGTLGGGNHFIEGGYDGGGALWMTIHSGSRNFGHSIARYHSKIAEHMCEKWGSVTNGIPFLPVDSSEGQLYIEHQKIAVEYSKINRKVMMEEISKILGSTPVDTIESIHNFIDETGMIRKGATPAHAGQRLIIPFNMRDGLAICEGRGNKKYNYSAPHGAGRLMSRTEARNVLNVEDFVKKMRDSGVYTTTANKSTIDESPDAYKNMQSILDNIQETVGVVEFIRPIYNLKSAE